MGTIITCDRCSKRKGKSEDGWSGVRVNGNSLGLKELSVFFTTFELCPDCAKIVVPKIVNILKKK